MKEVRYSSVAAYSVQNERQAKLLIEHGSFRYFAPFLAKTCTVSRAAEEVGCKIDTMFYRVRTFLEAGLLSVVQVEKRAGRPIKHYRSVHDAYYVPSSKAPFTNFEEAALQVLRTHEEVISAEIARMLRAQGREGWRIFRNKNGEVSAHSASDETHTLDYDRLPELPHSGAFANGNVAELFTDNLQLTDEEAKTLLSHLYQLRLDNKLEAEPSRQPYLLRVMMVPLSP